MYHAGRGTHTYTRTPTHFCEVFPDFLIVYTPSSFFAPISRYVLFVHVQLHTDKYSVPTPQSPNQATTPTPQLLAVATTLLHNPSNPTPFNLSSVCLIRAISKTCFRLTSPTTSPFPGVIPPLIFPFRSFTPAACRSKYEVVGVRRAK